MLFAAIAAGRSCLGTSCGVTACQAGAVNAPKALIRNVKQEQDRRSHEVERDEHREDGGDHRIGGLADDGVGGLRGSLGRYRAPSRQTAESSGHGRR
jgi:hypothetical protein